MAGSNEGGDNDRRDQEQTRDRGGRREGERNTRQDGGRQDPPPRQAQSSGTPAGIIFAMIGVVVFGIFSLLFGLTLLGLGDLASSVGSGLSNAGATQAGSAAQSAGTMLMLFGILQAGGAVVKFGGVVGMYKAASWGWYAIVGVFSLEVLQNIYGFVTAGVGIIGIVIFLGNAAILAYIFTKQDYFGVSFGSSSSGRGQPGRG